MAHGFFIVGTDTGVGKTYVAEQLLNAFNQQGFSTAALKPVASGCEEINGAWYNSDALALQQASNIFFNYADINHFAFAPRIAPHIAAAQEKINLTVKGLLESCQPVLNSAAEIILVEGAGGLLVPLNDAETLADFAVALGFPLVLVVGMRLGCINHALLTYESIINKKLKLVGWIANIIDPNMSCLAENIFTLQQRIASPLLTTINYQQSFINISDINFFNSRKKP